MAVDVYRRLVALTCVVCTCVCSVRSFYIPGVAPTEYGAGDKLEIKVRGGRCRRVGRSGCIYMYSDL